LCGPLCGSLSLIIRQRAFDIKTVDLQSGLRMRTKDLRHAHLLLRRINRLATRDIEIVES
jgi:hypothetical protein